MADDQKTARVSVRYPHDRFEHGIDGVDPITQDGVDVPKGQVEELRRLAREHNVPISVRGAD